MRERKGNGARKKGKQGLTNPRRKGSRRSKEGKIQAITDVSIEDGSRTRGSALIGPQGKNLGSELSAGGNLLMRFHIGYPGMPRV